MGQIADPNQTGSRTLWQRLLQQWMTDSPPEDRQMAPGQPENPRSTALSGLDTRLNR